MRGLVIVAALGIPAIGAAQSAAQIQAFHDRVVAVMTEMANRPLTPGDTFLTWNPKPGGLIHTVKVDSNTVLASLMRGGDGMIGTVAMHWSNARVADFDVRWTRRDSGGPGIDSATSVSGRREGMLLRVSGRPERTFEIPERPWGVADFGMEELLIPLLLSLPAGSQPQVVSVFRPYHRRWDSVLVTIHDTGGLRTAELLGQDKAHELLVIDSDHQLLWIMRYDMPGERRPLEGTARYAKFVEYKPLLESLSQRIGPAP